MRKLLWRAIEENKQLTGSEGVLRQGPAGLRLRPVRAPILQARFEYEHPRDDDCDASRDPTAKRLDDFEKLSLAARLHVAARASYCEGEASVDAGKLADKLRFRLNAFPAIDAEILARELAEMASAVKRRTLPAKTLALMKRGLHLSGMKIRGDLMLVNLDLPFSLRLQGCIVEGSVIIDHSTIQTLDLSGSVVNGVYGTFLRAKGNVRMRRTCSLGPVDFGGATIRGVLDVSDCLIAPFIEPSSVSAFVGERGVLNLSLANIANEFRANRSRIYGGMTMKGAVVHRSMFMERANIYAPIASLAKMAAQQLARSGIEIVDPVVAGALEAMKSDREVAAVLHNDPLMRRAETFGFPGYADFPAEQKLLYRLMAEGTRIRGSALRADGLNVHGSLFARGIETNGRLRMKYADIRGGLHLGGANLKSHKASETVLNALDSVSAERTQGYVQRFAESGRSAKHHEKGDADDFAMDIREARIAGDVNFDPFAFRPDGQDRCARILGTLKADNVLVGGGLCLKQAQFEPDFEVAPPANRSVREASLSLAHAQLGGDLRLENARGLRSLAAPHIKLGGSLMMVPQEAGSTKERSSVLGRCQISGVVDLRHAEIAGDASLLFRRKGDVALRLRCARVEGCLNIFPALPGWGAFGANPPGALDTGETLEIDRGSYKRAAHLAKRRRRMAESRTRRRLKGRAIRPRPDPARREMIDLRSAHVGAFRHPPGAWPSQHRLLIRGFVYDSPRTLGPLGAFSGKRRPVDRKAERIWSWICWSMIALASALLAGAGVLQAREVEGSADLPWLWPGLVGWFNSALLLSLPLFIAASIVQRDRLSPKRWQSRPMALDWLVLQPYKPNPFRRGRHYVVAHPYLQAAKVLRSAGRPLAADLVEWERLKLREQTLSWSNQPAEKAFFKLVGATSGFGFSIPRTIIIGLFCWIIGSMIFEYAHVRQFMIFIDNAQDLSLVFEHRFLSFAYSADLLLPFLDMGDAEHWHIARKVPSDSPGWLLFLTVAAWLLRVIGLVLTTIIAVSIGTRIESYLSRLQG